MGFLENEVKWSRWLRVPIYDYRYQRLFLILMDLPRFLIDEFVSFFKMNLNK